MGLLDCGFGDLSHHCFLVPLRRLCQQEEWLEALRVNETSAADLDRQGKVMVTCVYSVFAWAHVGKCLNTYPIIYPKPRSCIQIF